MQTQFFASQSVAIDVPEQPIPIQHYLRQPRRLVSALTDPSRIEQLSADQFRLKMRPIKFMALSLQPVVDMQVWTQANGTVNLQSVGCQIRGVEYINQRFQLELVGKLYPYEQVKCTQLKGQANLKVQVDLPPPFSFTPKPILEKTGNSLLKSVLVTVKQRLMHQLLADYYHWVHSTTAATETVQLNSVAVNPPTI